MQEESYQTNYALWFQLAIATIEAEFFNHNLEVAQQLSETVLAKAQTLLEKIKVYELQILFEINNNQMNQAITLATDVLALLGITLPNEAQAVQREIESLRREITLTTQEISNLVTLKSVEDPEKLAAIRILTTASSAAYIANPTLFPLIVLHVVQHCMKYGHSPLAASAYSWYGALLCGGYNEIEAGYAFGKLSSTILEKYNAQSLIAKVSNMFNVFIRPWKEPLHRATNHLPEAIQGGLENGDVEYAFYAAVHYCNYLFYQGTSLKAVYQKQAHYLPDIIKAKYSFHEGFLRINQQVVANLCGEVAEPQLLQGDILDGKTYLPQWQQNNIVFLVLCFYEAQTRLAYLFEDYQGAIEAGKNGWQHRQAGMGTLYTSEQNFYYSLALLTGKAVTAEQNAQVIKNQSQLQIWASLAPNNFQHKYDLVAAERNRVLGDKEKAIELYDRAIVGANANGYLQEEALANERAAKFYLGWGKEKIAEDYLIKAYYGYAHWGATAKVHDLAKRYPKLLASTLQQPQGFLSANETILGFPEPVTAPSSGPYRGNAGHTAGHTASAATFDLATILKASQILSSEIQIENLLATLLHTVIENAGADKGVLLMPYKNQWFVEAIATVGQPAKIESIELSDSAELPHSLINLVKRNLKPVVIDNATTDKTWSLDPYVVQQTSRSLLCTPLLKQGKPIAILFLENRVTSGAFTSDRIEVLQLLTSQATISLENARLYRRLEEYSQNLEAKVAQRTQELQEKNFRLQQTQSQLIQSEKMSALGQMVAGVAHEINNPINFIGCNIQHSQTYFQDLLSLIACYEAECPQPSDKLKAKLNSIDLPFLKEDIDKLLSSMETGSDRIHQIVSGLRNFSHLGESGQKPADLHEGLENTLLLLQHRFAATSDRPAITLVKNYGKLPPITCYAKQINQVFFNILSNAIDALSAPLSSESPQISIITQYQDSKARNSKTRDPKTVEILIADNGVGISEHVRQKIFDPFFTTKPVGQGTGLGLSSSYQIITEKHGGQLRCNAQLRQGTEFSISLPILD